MFSVKHTKVSLRFRQWRRKSYAAFHSIGRHITIGNVKNIVADTLLRKQKTISSCVDNISSFLNEKTFKEEEDPLEERQPVLKWAPVLQQPQNYKGENIFTLQQRQWPNELFNSSVRPFLF